MSSTTATVAWSVAELDAHGREARPLRSRRRPRRQSEHRQVHAVQRADGPQAAHRQLAGQDRQPRRGRLRVQQGPLQARRSAGHLFAALGVARRGGRARLPALRPARRHRRRRRRDGARAQPQSRAAGARDHRPRGGRGQPDGRGANAKGIEVDVRSLSRDLGVPAVGDRRAHRRRPARAARDGGRRCVGHHRDEAAARHRHAGVPARGRRARAAHRSRRRPACRTRAGSRFACSTATRRSKKRLRPAGWPQLVADQQQTGERFSQKIALEGAQ